MITSNSVLLVTFCRQKTFVTVVDDDECGHDFLSSDCLFFGCDLFFLISLLGVLLGFILLK